MFLFAHLLTSGHRMHLEGENTIQNKSEIYLCFLFSRYVGINLHYGQSSILNLGLVRVLGSATSNRILELVKGRLSLFGIDDINKQILSIVTDGCNVMLKIGTLISPVNQELCYAHSLQLSILDVLYIKNNAQQHQEFSNELDKDEDDNDIESECMLEQLEDEEHEFDIVSDYKPLIELIRRIVCYLRKPKQQEVLLKEQERIGVSELTMILDVRTRWTSLYRMLNRFNDLFRPALKALKILKNDDLYNQAKEIDRRILSDLVECLKILEVASKNFSKLDCTLLTAERIIKFTLLKLSDIKSPLARKLTNSIKTRFESRRSFLAHILIYLDTRKLNVISESDVVIYLERLIRRLYSFDESLNVSTAVDCASDSIQSMSLEKELNNYVQSNSIDEVLDRSRLTSSIVDEIENFKKPV